MPPSVVVLSSTNGVEASREPAVRSPGLPSSGLPPPLLKYIAGALGKYKPQPANTHRHSISKEARVLLVLLNLLG